MNGTPYEKLLADVAAGRVSVRAAAEKLAALPFEEMGHTKLDTHRAFRQGWPEVIFGAGKQPRQVVEIVRAARRHGHDVLVTRVDAAMAATLKRAFSAGRHHPVSRTFAIVPKKTARRGRVAVVTAGTSDIPVAEEAAVTLETMGHRVDRIYDVGVAGIHRLPAHMTPLRRANAVVVPAGVGWRGARQRGRRPRPGPGDRRPDVVWLRRELRRDRGASGDAELVQRECGGGQHRQRLRRRLDRGADNRHGHDGRPHGLTSAALGVQT